jgi:hypothetical protein
MGSAAGGKKHVLYQLSYLAAHSECSEAVAELSRSSGCCQALYEAVDELRLQQDVVGARILCGSVERRRFVARECDQAQVRVVAAQPCDGADAIEERHV